MIKKPKAITSTELIASALALKSSFISAGDLFTIGEIKDLNANYTGNNPYPIGLSPLDSTIIKY